MLVFGVLVFLYSSYGIYCANYLANHLNTYCTSSGPYSGVYNGIPYNGFYNINCSYGGERIYGANQTSPNLTSSVYTHAAVIALLEENTQSYVWPLLSGFTLIVIGLLLRFYK